MRRRLVAKTEQLDSLKTKLQDLQAQRSQCEKEIKAKEVVVKAGRERLAALEKHRDADSGTADGGSVGSDTLQIRQRN